MTESAPHEQDPRLGSRDPRAEAIERTGHNGAWVLEPSPPAVNEEPYADDPVDVGPAEPLDWNRWLEHHPEDTMWAAERMLAGPRSLGPQPSDLADTRTDLHRLAAYVIAPTRYRSNERFGLRSTLGGFGTPFFGADRQIRVVGNHLVDQRGDDARSTPITTLRAAADFLDAEIDADTAAESDSPALGDIDRRLDADPQACDFLARWFAMAFAALEALRADPATVDPSRPQLWPGHFDPAIEAGDENHRASYGASPGDAAHDEPYLYVSVWWPDRLDLDGDGDGDGDRWNATGFTGAVLGYADLGPGDPVEAALRFWTETRDALDRS